MCGFDPFYIINYMYYIVYNRKYHDLLYFTIYIYKIQIYNNICVWEKVVCVYL